MNYCPIDEAWGNPDYITNQFKVFNNPLKKTIENFTHDEKLVSHAKKFSNCDDFLTHLDKCRQCQKRIRDKYRPKILENFSEILDTNQDTVVLILVGVCIMLFFNLVNSAVSGKS